MKSRNFLFGTFISILVFMMFGCGSAPATTTAIAGSPSSSPSTITAIVSSPSSSPSTTTAIVSSPSSSPITTAISSSSNGLVLDTAIEQAAGRIENAFEVGTEIALVSVSSPSTQFSEYVLTYLETVLVNNGKLAIVDRSNLDRIREEQGFQLSGEVSDESAKAIGQLLGAGAIVTGGLVDLGDVYRLNLKAINVETARIAASYAGDVAGSQRIQTLLASGGGGARTGMRTATQTSTPAQAQITAGAVMPQGTNLAQQLSWIAKQGGDGAVYDIVINDDISMRPTAVSTRGRNITINIRSANPASPKIVELTGQGHLLSVESNITLGLQDIILKGHNNNNSALVFIETGGKVILNSGSKIIGNTNISNTASGGGIRLDRGILEINDGAEISGNTVRGGSSVNPHRDAFGAWDGHGGGIYAGNRSTITIQGGLITENKSDTRGGALGGGIFVIGGSTVSMTGGIISRNSCTVGYSGYRLGGGVYVYDTASSFTKTSAPGSNSSGIIYGSAGGNANAATDGGHAIYRDFANPKQRNSTLGYDDEISTTSNSGWNQ